MAVVGRGTFVAPAHQIPYSEADTARLKREEKTLRRYQNVLIEEPDVSSLASLVLLIRQYMVDDFVPQGQGTSYGVYKKYRRRFIDKCIKDGADLRCYKCNCWLHEAKNNNSHKRLTVDHILELRNGGSLTDINNMRLACEICNSTRPHEEEI